MNIRKADQDDAELIFSLQMVLVFFCGGVTRSDEKALIIFSKHGYTYDYPTHII